MKEKTLSIFIDESGDFGPYDFRTPYYIVSMVFHDQSIDISKNIDIFEDHLRYNNYINHAVHTGPLIRRESYYENDFLTVRKSLFNALFNFARKLDIHYTSLIIDRKDCSNELELIALLSKGLSSIIKNNEDYFNQFDEVNIYYDNGQVNLTKILLTVFSILVAHVNYRKVKPVDYKLFQVADLICTMELLAKKAEKKCFSNSERQFFNNERDFKKNYLKWIRKKKLN